MPAIQTFKLHVLGRSVPVLPAESRPGRTLADLSEYTGPRCTTWASRLDRMQIVQMGNLPALQAFEMDFAFGLRSQGDLFEG
jgi:hypothetical protein